MKIFIRVSSLGEKNPEILASYPSDSPINAETHVDMIMFEVPQMAFLRNPNEPFDRLPDDWRERLAEPILQAEVKRRIDDVLSPLDQLITLRESIDLLMEHGNDVSKWPTQAKHRKAEIDDAWNYVREVKARARAFKSIPHNPISDKNWPTRIVKK